MVCIHDERYLAEKAIDPVGANRRWFACEALLSDTGEPPVEHSHHEVPAEGSWRYCRNVLSPLLSRELEHGNAAIPSATVLAILQALARCSSGETRELIERLIGSKWSSDAKPSELLGLAPTPRCSPTYRANIATSVWLARRCCPSQRCRQELDSIGVERAVLDGNLNVATKRISNWVEQNARDALEPAVNINEAAQLMLASAISFKDAWKEEFWRRDGKRGPFFGWDGVHMLSFMRGRRDGSVSRFERCRVSSLALTSGASLVVVLPERGVCAEKLLKSGEAIDAAVSHVAGAGSRCLVDWWLPRFDVSGTVGGSASQLIPGVEKLRPSPDFSPVMGGEPSEVPACMTCARVKIDEQGIEAAGYTLVAVEGMCEEKLPIVPFVVDRPFVFVRVSNTGEPMFLGAVGRPKGY